MPTGISDTVFQLVGGKQRFALMTPSPVSLEDVTAAWSYAIRYSAKGLDLPDFDAAIALLKERHPSWTVFTSQFPTVGYDKSLADADQPDA